MHNLANKAMMDLPQSKVPHQLFREEQKMHILPKVVAKPAEGDGYYNAFKCMAFPEDLPAGFYDDLEAEYTAEIEPLVMAATPRPTEILEYMRDRSVMKKWLKRRMYHTAFLHLPIGLQWDVPSYPLHSKRGRAWEKTRSAAEMCARQIA